MEKSLTYLCISFYFKGNAFLESCKAAGNTVYLLTKKSLEHKPWPRASLDDIFFMDDDANSPENIAKVLKGAAWLMRNRKIDRIVALDDFDVEKAASVREEFRIPGMGLSTSRFFRDKLAMRVRAHEAGILVPAFSPLFNDDEVNAYADSVSPPWVVKPRAEASAVGIKKVHSKEQLWEVIDGLGDNRHNYLVEQFKPGDVYHVDALTFDGVVCFAWASQYLNTPFEVAHGGGIFRSVTVEFNSKDEKALLAQNKKVMKAFRLQYSASHTEFIKCHEDGKIYFLETSSRVGGANLGEMVEAASGINLWSEWAKLENATAKGKSYSPPSVKMMYSGIIISLSRHLKNPATEFTDSEIVWRMDLDHHIGLIVASKSRDRVLDLLDRYVKEIGDHYHASAPIQDKPSN